MKGARKEVSNGEGIDPESLNRFSRFGGQRVKVTLHYPDGSNDERVGIYNPNGHDLIEGEKRYDLDFMVSHRDTRRVVMESSPHFVMGRIGRRYPAKPEPRPQSKPQPRTPLPARSRGLGYWGRWGKLCLRRTKRQFATLF